MKFNKTAAALAVAGFAVSPLAQAAPVVTLSGGVAINLSSDDSDATDGKWTFSGDDSTLNIAATDTLGNGLTGYANYRLDSALSGSITGGDSIHVGIKGGFGDIRIGEVANAIEYGQVAGDILRDAGVGIDGGISYTGSFSGVTVGLSAAPGGNESTLGAGVKFNAGGFGIGIGAGQQGAADDPSVSAGASFSFAGASIAVAYKSYETTVPANAGGELAFGYIDAAGSPIDDEGVPYDGTDVVDTTPSIILTQPTAGGTDEFESIGISVGYTIADVGVSLTYEADQTDASDADKIRLDASYGLGGGWGTSARVNITDDVTDYRVQFSKSF